MGVFLACRHNNTPFSSVTCRLLFLHPIIFTIMDKLKKILNTQLLEVKRPYGPSCPSFGWLICQSVGRSVIISSFTSHAPIGTCLCLSFSFFSIHIYKESFRWYPILQPHNPITPLPPGRPPSLLITIAPHILSPYWIFGGNFDPSMTLDIIIPTRLGWW